MSIFEFEGFEYIGDCIPAYDSNGNRFKAHIWKYHIPGTVDYNYTVIDADLFKGSSDVRKFIASELSAHSGRIVSI